MLSSWSFCVQQSIYSLWGSLCEDIDLSGFSQECFIGQCLELFWLSKLGGAISMEARYCGKHLKSVQHKNNWLTVASLMDK